MGHIVAPQAEIWNYYNTSDGGLVWGGGNLNGTAIVKSFHSGVMEMHMWAYVGSEEHSIDYVLSGTKTYNDEVPVDSYEFELTYVPDEDGNMPAGIITNTFPLTATSVAGTGDITFPSVSFDQAGTYYFIAKEIIPEDTDGIIYDKTEYQIAIEVTSNGSTLSIDDENVVITKIVKDADGADISDGESVDGILFENKSDTGESVVKLTFTKVNTSGNTLSGATFTVTEIVGLNDETKVTDGYSKTFTSGDDGKLTISGLDCNKYYILKETVAPEGYILEDGYWILYINDSGALESVTSKSDAPEISITGEHAYKVLNEEIVGLYLDVELTKSNQLNELLSDVEFQLDRIDGTFEEESEPTLDTTFTSLTYTTDIDGTIKINTLKEGTYKLIETSTPEGHQVHEGYWLIVVEKDDTATHLVATITEYDSDHKVVDDVTDNIIYNYKLVFELPDTGGLGDNAWYIIGIIVVIMVFLLYEYRRTKQLKRRR